MVAVATFAALALALLAPSASGRGQAAELTLPEHPRLLITRAEVPQVLARIEQAPFARAYYEGLRARCEAAAREPVVLPPRGGQWWHWYSCPTHGGRLRTEGPTRHVCPADGQVFTGYPYDDVVLSADHDRLAATARDLGLFYVLTGERKWADAARRILLAYADRYLSYRLHNTRGEERVGGGRVLPQTLDESIWLISMAYAADAVWDTLSAAEIDALRTRLFYPAAVDVIQKHKMSIHNIQCYKNSAVGLVGLLFGDRALVADAIDSPSGFRQQVAKGVRDDGAWFEGAWSYHFYTMEALRHLTEPARRCGIDLYDARLKAMFTAPIELAQPDGVLPAFNDSPAATATGNPNYEIALARYNDARLAAPLRRSLRGTLQALLCGVHPLPAAPPATETSRNLPASGYAILRSGEGPDAAWLCHKYGPHGGGHGHPDKLSFVLYAGKQVVAGDPGTSSYGVPLHAGWYKTTLAHNTLLVDQTSQFPAEGRCLDFRAGSGWSGAYLDAGEAVPNVTFRRATFLLGDRLAVFIDTAQDRDGKEREMDFAFHPNGVWLTAERGEAVDPGKRPGYAYLRDVRSLRRTGAAAFAFGPASAVPGAASRWVAFAASGPVVYLTGTGVGANTDDRVPIVLARRTGASAVNAWAVALTPSQAPPTVTLEDNTSRGRFARVEHDGQAWRVGVGATGKLVATRVERP